MAIPRVYLEQPLQVNEIIAPDNATCHHLANVLRLKSGEELLLFNGDTYEYVAKWIATGKKKYEIHIVEQQTVARESNLELNLGLCLFRGKALNISIQKAVELGVHAITPLISAKCDLPQNNAARTKRQKDLRQTIISACEQCGRTKLPILHQETPFATWLEQQTKSTRIICDFGPNTIDWDKKPQPNSTVALTVGPAGGWSETESILAKENDWLNMSLGPRTLRSETATIAAITLLQYNWGDLATS